MALYQDDLKALILTFVQRAIAQWSAQMYTDIEPPNMESFVRQTFEFCWVYLTRGTTSRALTDLEYEIVMNVKKVFALHLEGYVADNKRYDISITTLRKAVNERYGEDYGFSDPLWVDHECVRVGIYNTEADVAFGANFYFKIGKFA
jgi:hypothetical protein